MSSTFSCEPSKYNKYRLQYPSSLFEFLHKITNNAKIVLDCGAGSGQAALGLAKCFNEVIATDLSFNLLKQGPQIKNIWYVQANAEQLPIRNHSVELVTIAQAIHWFNLEFFYNEVKRVLKPKGIIAAWCYNKATVNLEVDSIIDVIYKKISGSDVPSLQRKYVHDGYSTLPFPFIPVEHPNFEISMQWNFHELLGHIETWPGLIDYRKKFGDQIKNEFRDTLLNVWGNPEQKKSINWSIYLLLGRL